MKPKMIWANLGVKDLNRTQQFYQALGFQLNGQPNEQLVSFLFGENNFIIHFFLNEKLEQSLEGSVANLDDGNEVMFSLSIHTKSEFDHSIEQIKMAGGKILFNSNHDRKTYYDENGFYVCVFTDPDGHKFNLLYNAN